MTYLKDTIRRIRRLPRLIVGSDILYLRQHKCATLRLGSDYGGWTICADSLDENSIIYSFGVGKDISFDLSIIKRFGSKVFAFDPTPGSVSWVEAQDLPENFSLVKYGLSDYDGQETFYMPVNPNHISHSVLKTSNVASEKISMDVRKLETLAGMLGHDKIDILKMDIEGSEYDAIPNILSTNIMIKQILVEFHHRFKKDNCSKTHDAIKILNKNGFKIFSISPTGEEYSFINIT